MGHELHGSMNLRKHYATNSKTIILNQTPEEFKRYRAEQLGGARLGVMAQRELVKRDPF